MGTPDFEAEKEALRERQRHYLADQRAAEEAEHDRRVRVYWEQRAIKNPDDPEVLRARADLIQRGLMGATGGTVVTAETARVAAEGGG